MFFDCFLKGMSLAFYIVVPLGAISVLYIKRTLQKGVLSGVISSLGVTTAEAFYASAAIYGLTFVSKFLLQYQFWLQLCGTIFLVTIGVKTFLSDPPKKSIVEIKEGLIRDYLSMLILTLANPLTIIGFVAVFTSFGAHSYQNELCSIAMLFGFILMSFSYCIFLVFLSNYLKSRFSSRDLDLLKMLNQISGLVIVIFTLLAFAMALVKN